MGHRHLRRCGKRLWCNRGQISIPVLAQPGRCRLFALSNAVKQFKKIFHAHSNSIKMHTVNQVSKFSLILVAMFFSLAAVQAQTKTITGTVGYADGTLVSGGKVCSVLQPDKCVDTNQNGAYSIDVPVAETMLKATLPSPSECQSDQILIPADNKVNFRIQYIVCA